MAPTKRPGPRPRQRTPGLGSANDPYAGYGIRTPGAPCPPGAEASLADCIRAMQQILKDSLQLARLAPWIHPPFRARTINDYERSILSTTAALDAGVNAAGLSLQSALTVSGTPPYQPALLEMAATTDFQTIFEFENTINTVTRIATWGLTINNVQPEGILIRVAAGSVAGGPPAAPDALLSSADFAGHQPVFLLLQGKQTLKIQAALRDTTSSPAVIDFGFTGWTWPVRNREDGPEGVIPRSGYGLDCR